MKSITFNGETNTIEGWTSALKLGRGVIRYRLLAGWPLEEVLSPKVKNNLNNHGEVGCRLYTLWQKNKRRCTSKKHPQYKLYGAKGIRFFKEWSKYEVFKEWATGNGYSEKLYLERKDIAKNYDPDNCYWSETVNMHNQHYSMVEYGGEVLHMSEVAKRANVNVGLVSIWVKKGKDLNLLKPSQPVPLLTIGEEAMTRKAWCERRGIKYQTYLKRLKKGVPVEDAAGLRRYQRIGSKYQEVTLGSETHSIREWARIWGVSANRLYYRFDHGIQLKS